MATVIMLFRTETEIEISGARRVDARKGELDTSKAKKILGYKSEYDLRRGVKETIRWFLDVYCPIFGIKPKKGVVLK